MKKQYETEQAGIRDEIEELEKNVVPKDNRELSVAKFTALIRKYRDFEELTTPMLIEFIDKILVHEREYKGRPNSPQKVEIFSILSGR